YLISGGHDVNTRRVGTDPGTESGQTIAENLPHRIDNVGLPVERAAGQDIHRAGIDAGYLVGQGLGERNTIDDAVHRRGAVNAMDHADILRLCCTRLPSE